MKKKETLDEEISVLCEKYNFTFENGSSSNNKLEEKYVLANVNSTLEYEKSKTVVITIMGVFVAIGLFLTRIFYELNAIIGVIYFIVVLGVVSWLFLINVRSYLIKIKDLSKLKELLTLKNSEEQTGNQDISNGIQVNEKGSGERLLSSDKNIGKTIGVMHFVYLSIIFAGVVIWLVSYIFADSNYAGSLLAFAATLSSILLAVIAIIITLIDVAGQRNNIFDVKNSVEELKKAVAEFNELQNEYMENNNLIKVQMADLLSKQQGANELIEKLNSVVALQNKEGGNDNQELTSQLRDIKSLLESQNSITNQLQGNKIDYRKYYNHKNNNNNNKGFEIEEGVLEYLRAYNEDNKKMK
ncbi:hypothetical protein NCCP2222_02040 [Sporosarcina sp. NCCP-2222]|uniref:hypothetical protein n=1 Tax=Sporosarcina sp. NCCP-2222 TaxID=2935073 RepID=UPI00208BC2A2|nr:hypothetical protein [Sporosarcina sp. NCCP-2222]GKV54257.1 hypothetical protein NCCP2222_02040 [Sporosarcina sp. NCCP-2222]